tara:strand:- start:520 stop:1302 length:783 start_codon:yes stop_codon:yes gene_type:complete
MTAPDSDDFHSFHNQAHFNSQVFRQEQEIYLREAISWEAVEEPDNQACISMLATASGEGIPAFALLDEQCRLPKCTHKTFVERLFHEHPIAVSSGVLGQPVRGSGLAANEGFCVRHFAGQVTYCTEGFLQKNNNSLHADLERILATADHPFLKALREHEEARKPARPKGAPPPKPSATKARFSSVSAHFLTQLGELYTTLQARDHVTYFPHTAQRILFAFVTRHDFCSGDQLALCALHQPQPHQKGGKLCGWSCVAPAAL